jgi:hypothetical protein
VKTNWILKLIKYLKKVYFRNDKRVAAYLICVAIATVFWFLNALSKTYTEDINVPVSYVNFPNNKTLASKPPEQFDLKIEAHGFTILRYKLSFFFIPLEFNVNDLTHNRMTESNKNSFAFPARQFLTELSYQMSNEVKIQSMSPDTLFFRFDQMGQKRIRVKPVLKINLKKQFEISGDIKISPDSVLVNGPQSVLDSLCFIATETLLLEGADQTISSQSRISPVKGLYFEAQSVKVNIPIEEYTEEQLSVPVVVENQPTDLKVKLFPANVKISFQVGLSRFSQIHPEDFKLSVSYSDIKEGKQRLKINPELIPAYIYALKINPEELEYLIESQMSQ